VVTGDTQVSPTEVRADYTIPGPTLLSATADAAKLSLVFDLPVNAGTPALITGDPTVPTLDSVSTVGADAFDINWTPAAGGGAQVVGITVAATYLDVQFDKNVVLATLGLDALAWEVSALGGAYPVTVTNASQQASDTIRLAVTEMTGGGNYTLDLVVGLVQTSDLTNSNEASSTPFVGAATAPAIVSATAQSARTVLVTFDRVMKLADLADETKFSITGPNPAVTPLAIHGAAPQSTTSTLLTTDPMQPDTVAVDDYYTVTSTAQSAAGN
jgi:hypothetical protein